MFKINLLLIHPFLGWYHVAKRYWKVSEREGLLVTRWLTESSAYQPWQSIMVSHRAVDQFVVWECERLCVVFQFVYSQPNWWVSTVQLINCSIGYHHRLSGFICRAQNQPPSYREDIANRYIAFWPLVTSFLWFNIKNTMTMYAYMHKLCTFLPKCIL